MTLFPDRAAFDAALAALPEPAAMAIESARAHQKSLCKPEGSLGRLEDIAVFMAGWQGTPHPRLRRGQTIVFAGNHGIARYGVSAFPPELTCGMVENFERGGAAINALSLTAGLDFKVVALDLDRPTSDFTTGPAMSESETLAALSAGAAAVEDDLDLLVIGEMGIANTTTAAALACLVYGGEPAEWVGRGTGIDTAGVARKTDVVERAMAVHRETPRTALDLLAAVGGRELAAMAGAVLGARLKRIPVVLDGFICCTSIAPLVMQNSDILHHCIAGHQSEEPGHGRVLKHFGLSPLLRLNMRLGEASGAAVATLLIRAALATHTQMATIEEALAGAAPRPRVAEPAE
ncbi:nicotinate-nucleotide--dimethylbenzimidazole phosphoribosyltransferase [Pedomonas sp. V897]|uniref:nicotinate-nucleotide--dimethylbenzimidazole phosphoribosyltransferase n=1 Tax=Pedomonas sp. V897 TaxID=3446482 RepID=UPI003EDF792E